jgi:hypothetical protein
MAALDAEPARPVLPSRGALQNVRLPPSPTWISVMSERRRSKEKRGREKEEW